MNNRWKQKGIPHKGWSTVDFDDLKPAGAKTDYAYGKCDMCKNQRLRYVYTMEHPDFEGTLEVGSTCADKMARKYFEPEDEEFAAVTVPIGGWPCAEPIDQAARLD